MPPSTRCARAAPRCRRSTVSRLFPDKLRVVLTPDEVLAGGRSVVADPAAGAEPWQGAVAALKSLEWTKPCRVTAVLSNHFVRYAVLPWSDGLSTPAEERSEEHTSELQPRFGIS